MTKKELRAAMRRRNLGMDAAERAEASRRIFGRAGRLEAFGAARTVGVFCSLPDEPDTAETLEGQLLRLADKIAYINADIDDALRGGIIYPIDIPLEISNVLGFTHSERIDTLTVDIIRESAGAGVVRQSGPCREAMSRLREFMFENVYRNPVAKGEESKAQDMLRRLFECYVSDPDRLPPEFQDIREREGVERAVCDYIAGMTDKYAVEKFSEAFIPMSWGVK